MMAIRRLRKLNNNARGSQSIRPLCALSATAIGGQYPLSCKTPKGRGGTMERVKRLIEITPSQLKLYEAIGRDFPDLSPVQTARMLGIVRKWLHDEVQRVKGELVSGNFIPH